MVNLIEGRRITQIFDYPDNLKFHSSVTLFANAAPDNQVFKAAVQKYFKGEYDKLTLDTLRTDCSL